MLRLIRERAGPITGFALTLAIAAYAFFTNPAVAVAEAGSPCQQHHTEQAAINQQPSLFVAIWSWARDNRDSIDPITAVFALIVAALVAFATFALWRATRDLAESTEDLAIGAREQSEEMRQTRALAERQFEAAARQADLAVKQHGLQREQFLAEYPPRIQIRSVAIGRAPDGSIFQARNAIRGSLVIVNAGRSTATIHEADYRFFWGYGLPIAPPLEKEVVRPLLDDLPHTMERHESCLVTIESASLLGPEAPALAQGKDPYYLYVMGAVRFSDWNGLERWMGFCRMYRPNPPNGDGSFEPVKNADYEYED